MKLLGFNFTKVSIEKFSDKFENLKINSNIDISEIKEVKQSMLNSKDTVLSIKFSYILNYNPDYAKIDFKISSPTSSNINFDFHYYYILITH